jgi:23S rRNA (pseudouridine1915-N3)-methyltransferase
MIEIICVGKLSTKGYKEAFDHYFKQIHKMKIIEIKESNIQTEAKLILKAIDSDSHIIVLTIEGIKMSSEGFSEHLGQYMDTGKKIQCIIGGSDGLDPSVKALAHKELSLSNMTFPHQLARIMLIEQIYRAIKIMEHHPYHK